MLSGLGPGGCLANFVMTPVVVILSIPLSPANTANHSAPTGPVAMLPGKVSAWRGYSVITPAVVIRPILPALPSVNQSAPSGPVTMPPPHGRGYSVKLTDCPNKITGTPTSAHTRPFTTATNRVHGRSPANQAPAANFRNRLPAPKSLDYRSLIIYTIMISSILYFQRNTTGAALISSKY